MVFSRDGHNFDDMDEVERIEVDKDTVDNLVQTLVARKDLSGIHQEKAQDMIEILMAFKLRRMKDKKDLIKQVNEAT